MINKKLLVYITGGKLMIRVFHHDDLDGYGAAAVIKYLLLPRSGYDSDVEYIELNYNHVTDKEKLIVL